MRHSKIDRRRAARAVKVTLLAGSAFSLIATTALALDHSYDGGVTVVYDKSGGPSSNAPSVGLSFEGISQVDVRNLHGGFSEIPPDTMGAIGATQFMETSNGAYAVYNKTTGTQEKILADGIFWAQAGQPGSDGSHDFSSGDSRVLFDSRSQRWIVESIGATLETVQIAVSNTSDATGGWKSTSFTGFAAGGNGLADYPTLAIDSKAVYIGTNDFDLSQPAANQFQGVTLNVINRNDLFGGGAPNVNSLKQFFDVGSTDKGFAIQGVNQLGNSDAGKIVAASDFSSTGDVLRYNVNNPGTPGATETAPVSLGLNNSDPALNGGNAPARQPDGSRVIDALDVRISSAAWEQAGKIYIIQTVTPTGTDHNAIVWTIVNATTNAVISTGEIGNNGDGYDYYQGSIAVNKSGQVVIGYDRSGDASKGADGNITFFAQTFNPNGGGGLTNTGTFLLHASPIGDYHNGSPEGSPPVGRQRWGDYSQVTVDPNNPESFWAIGEFARPYQSSTSFSRWGTWITDLTLSAVPEPGTWAMMLLGVGLMGGALRRRARTAKLSVA